VFSGPFVSENCIVTSYSEFGSTREIVTRPRRTESGAQRQGCEEKKELKKGWEETERHPHPFSAAEKLPSGSTDARKAIFIVASEWEIGVGGTRGSP
jgi:hypothetical protein